jgi:hypothetical protein
MGALLGGGEALPIDNMGAMSGTGAEAMGGVGAGGLMDASASNNIGQVQGLLESLNPVQQVGLQGLLGSIGPMRGPQAGGQAPTPTGQPLPVAPPASPGVPSAQPQQMNAPVGTAIPGGGMGAGGRSTASSTIQRMARQQEPQQAQQTPEQMSRQTPGNLPVPQMAYDWAGYRAQARDATEGMNQMPYTFSSYNQMNGMNVSDIMKMFYPGYEPPGTAPKAAAEPEKPVDDVLFYPWSQGGF